MSGDRGGLNGSTQHQLEVQLREPRTLKSFASVKSNKNTTLYRFNEYKPGRAGRYGEALSNQPIRGCCIDRLSWQRLSGVKNGFVAQNRALFIGRIALATRCASLAPSWVERSAVILGRF